MNVEVAVVAFHYVVGNTWSSTIVYSLPTACAVGEVWVGDCPCEVSRLIVASLSKLQAVDSQLDFCYLGTAVLCLDRTLLKCYRSFGHKFIGSCNSFCGSGFHILIVSCCQFFDSSANLVVLVCACSSSCVGLDECPVGCHHVVTIFCFDSGLCCGESVIQSGLLLCCHQASCCQVSLVNYTLENRTNNCWVVAEISELEVVEEHPAAACCCWVVGTDTDTHVAVDAENSHYVVVVCWVHFHSLVGCLHGVWYPVCATYVAPVYGCCRSLGAFNHEIADALYHNLVVASEDVCWSLLVASLPVCVCCLGRTRTHEGLYLELVSTLLNALQILINLEVTLIYLSKTGVGGTTCARCRTFNCPTIEALLLCSTLILNGTLVEPWVGDEVSNIVTRLSGVLCCFVSLCLYISDECKNLLCGSGRIVKHTHTFIPLSLEIKTLLVNPVFEFYVQSLKSNVCCYVGFQFSNVLLSTCVYGESLLLGSGALCCFDVLFYSFLVLWAIGSLCQLVVE